MKKIHLRSAYPRSIMLTNRLTNSHHSNSRSTSTSNHRSSSSVNDIRAQRQCLGVCNRAGPPEQPVPYVDMKESCLPEAL
jgi:hypothetical protein